MASPRPSFVLLAGVAVAAALALTHTAEIRERAELALGRGMPAREAELARGFVLGQDERIDSTTVEDFRRSGLAHLLAVSGQNVALLALLAMPALASLGIPLRMRLVWVLALIVVYVPLAGAEPSIMRAGVMGGLSVIATLVGRRSSRLYALGLAAAVTLAVDPHVAADVGWQLSFAAVLSILLLAGALRRTIAARLGAGGWRDALADGTAMTIAATLGTAPLIAFHFDAVSTTTLFANLLALPAVAPAMWLGMLAAAGGQVPGFPVQALNFLNAPLLAYIAQVASWCGRPGWAYPQLRLDGVGLAVSYAMLALAAALATRLARRRRLARIRNRGRQAGRLYGGEPRSPPCRRPRLSVALACLALAALAWTAPPLPAGAPSPPHGLRVSIFDIGQGDAVLLQPAGAPAVLVDGGPPGGDLGARLRSAGIEQLGAVVVTHDQSDHAGGVAELLGRVRISRLAFSALDGRMVARARRAGAMPRRLARGSELRAGQLRLEVLWPPTELLDGRRAREDPNALALVILARWHRFSMLLTADAEAEATPIDSGPVDVLKVAHHGSDDAGLDELLTRLSPKLAVISVGEGNPFGHPTPTTLATLRRHRVPTLRTDRDGTVAIDVRGGAIQVGTGG